MLPRHELVIKTAAGVRQAVMVDTSADPERGGFLSFGAAMRVNGAGTLRFDLMATNQVIPILESDGQVELWRNGRMLFRTLYQPPPQYRVDERNQEYFTATCVGEKDLLARAIIAWPAKTINRTLFTGLPAETIMHTLVRYNATADATVANGRLLDNPMSLMSVEPDLGRGAILPEYSVDTGRVLLDVLQEVATVGGVDVDLIQDGPRHWTVRVFPGQVGVDRSTTVLFSRQNSNMGQLEYNATRPDIKTVVLVGGQGERATRAFAVRYGPEYSTQNHREYFHAYSGDVGGSALLEVEGDRVMEEKRGRSTLSFEPLQVSGTRFDVDYGLGDLVTATYRDVHAIYQVAGVSLSPDKSGKETIAVELSER